MRLIDRLEAMLAAGRDAPMLRLSLGTAWLDAGDLDRARAHLEAALEQDPAYSAAWTLLGKVHEAAGDPARAAAAWGRGIEVAEGRGDKQAAREMGVFLKRLRRKNGEASES